MDPVKRPPEHPLTDAIDIHIDVQQQETHRRAPLVDEDRTTIVFLRAVKGTIAESPSPEEDPHGVDRTERARRVLAGAATSADEAARFAFRHRVVAPLLMLLALGLLVAAAGSSC